MDDMMLLVLCTVIFNGIFDAVVVAYLAGRRSRKALEKMIKEATEGDPEALEFVHGIADVLMKWAAERPVKTGKKIKVGTGEFDANEKEIMSEVDEILTPIQLMAKIIGKSVMDKFNGSLGNQKTQIKNMLIQEASETGNGLSPTALAALSRGKIGPALAEVGLPFMNGMINKKKADTSASGGWKD